MKKPVTPQTIRVLRTSCDHVDGGFRVHLTEFERILPEEKKP